MTYSTWKGRREARPIVEWLQRLTDDEVGAVLGSTSVALHFLLNASPIAADFPEQHFRGSATVDDDACDMILLFNVRLIKIREEINRIGELRADLVASGLTIFVVSFRALACPALMKTGAALWTELRRGVETWFDNLCGLAPELACDPSTVDALWPFPNAFAPDVEAWPFYCVGVKSRTPDHAS